MDSQLQDYLDGRLDAEARRTFEGRLRAEPDLAARLAEYRCLQDALREDEPLPPGFYTRTREDFAKRGGRKKRRGFGLLSWEALGLVAAAGLALALFAPGILRNELPVSTDLAVARPEERADKDLVKSVLADADPIELDSQAGEAEAEADAEAAPGRLEEEQTGHLFSPEPVAAEKEDRTARRDEVTPAPPTARRSSPERKRVVATSSESADSATQAASSRVPSTSPPRIAVRAEPLPTGVVSPNTVRALPGIDAKRRLADQEGKREVRLNYAKSKTDDGLAVAQGLAESNDIASEERVVWIGLRSSPFSCSGVQAEALPNRYLIYLGEVSPDQPAALGGCAVYLPADGRTIEIVDPQRFGDE